MTITTTSTSSTNTSAAATPFSSFLPFASVISQSNHVIHQSVTSPFLFFFCLTFALLLPTHYWPVSLSLILLQRVVWHPNAGHKKSCMMKGGTEESCQNYVRILTEKNHGHYLICGTNAYNPMCREFRLNVSWLASWFCRLIVVVVVLGTVVIMMVLTVVVVVI